MLDVQPVDPERMGRNGQLLREGAEALGVRHAPLRRNAGACVQCSSCPNGCRLDAKRAMHVSYLPRAVAAGARVRAGVEARQIAPRTRARRRGPLPCRRRRPAVRPAAPVRRPRTRRGHRRRGAFGTPELLLRSEVRSASGQLGRNLRIHPACWVGARFDEEVRGWEGVMQSYAVEEWEPQGLLLEATFTPLAFGGSGYRAGGAEHQERLLAFGHLASTGVHLSDRSSGTRRASPATARCGSATGSPATTRGGSCSASRGRPSCTTPPGPARSIRRSPGSPRCRASGSASSRPPRPAAQRAAPRGLPPDGHRAHGRRSAAGRRRARRRRPRNRGPLRRRRQPAAELARGQPDDDDRPRVARSPPA